MKFWIVVPRSNVRQLCILIVLFSFHLASALDQVFPPQYPGKNEILESIISDLKRNMLTLQEEHPLEKAGDYYIFDLGDDKNSCKDRYLILSIERLSDANKTEDLVTALCKSNKRQYKIIRTGMNLPPISDDDLVHFNFKISDSESTYQILAYPNGLDFNYKKLSTGYEMNITLDSPNYPKIHLYILESIGQPDSTRRYDFNFLSYSSFPTLQIRSRQLDDGTYLPLYEFADIDHYIERQQFDQFFQYIHTYVHMFFTLKPLLQ